MPHVTQLLRVRPHEWSADLLPRLLPALLSQGAITSEFLRAPGPDSPLSLVIHWWVAYARTDSSHFTRLADLTEWLELRAPSSPRL